MNSDVVKTFKNPSMGDTVKVINAALSQKRSIIVIGSFKVKYEGRATSELGYGERLLLIKKDGSILIHRPTGYKPVNWQPPNNYIYCKIKEGYVVLTAKRKKQRETLNVTLKKTNLIVTADLMDVSEFKLHLTEDEIHERILSQPSLIEKGFKVLKSEKNTETGSIDILGKDRNDVLVVVEIKRRKATTEAVEQLKRYVEEILRREKKRVRGILVSPSISKSALIMLKRNMLEYKRIRLEKLRLKEAYGNKKITSFLEKRGK